MNTLNKLLVAAALTLGVAAPASAAAWNGGKGLDEKIAQLDQQVKDAQGANKITADQASSLGASVAELQRLHASFSKGGINREEQVQLERRIAKVKQQVDRIG